MRATTTEGRSKMRLKFTLIAGTHCGRDRAAIMVAAASATYPGSKNDRLRDERGRQHGHLLGAPERERPAPLDRRSVVRRVPELLSGSPDGTKIAYADSLTGTSDIYVINADGSGQTRLTTSSDVEFGAAWSPEGNQIAYVRSVNGDPVQ
jgi:hypothetical protein